MSKINLYFIAAVAAVLSMVVPSALADAVDLSTTPVAANNLGQVANNIRISVESFKTLIIQIGCVIGIGLFVMGLFWIYKDGQESGRGHLKNGLIAMLVGAMLVSMGAILDTTTNTALKNNSAQSNSKSFTNSTF